jgi:hypothetical protein
MICMGVLQVSEPNVIRFVIGSAKYVDILDVSAVGMRKKGNRTVIVPPQSEEQAQRWR